MARSLYIAAIEPRSGKSVVALGMMELLSRRISKVGYFRPVIPSSAAPDNNIQLIRKRYNLDLPYEDMYAYSHEKAQAMAADGRNDALFKDILNKYKALESKCNFVLCEGTDFTGVSSAFEFDFNADVANNLGCPILALVNGRGKSTEDILDAVQVAQESFEDKGCTILATMINRVDPDKVDAVASRLKDVGSGKYPIYVLPQEATLGKPTVGDIANALKAQILQGEPDGLNREVHDFKVAAMNLPHFLDYVAEGDLIITPGDRSDVILGSLATALSEAYPHIAGMLLTGGLRPEHQVQRLIEGFKKQSPVPVIGVETDTYTTAMNASSVRPSLTPENDRKIAAALGIFESHVDLKKLEDRIDVVRSKRVTPIMFEYELIERAKADRQHIVLPEGEEERILRASEILLRRGVVDITLLGKVSEIRQKIGALGLNLEGINIIDPATSELLASYAHMFYEMRKHKGISEEIAKDTMTDVSYFGTMMVHNGDVGGMVSGAIHTTGDTIRPALQIIRTQPGFSVVSSVFLMCLADRVLVYGDCAVNPEPNAGQLADIAISSADTAGIYGIEPRIAMCSYSTGESGSGKDVDKVREATRIAKERRPDLKIEGPIQYDAAVDAGVARTKLPESEVAGKATVFIFPDLNTGNNLYKAVQRSANAVAIGPVLQGLKKPVNDLSRGCTIADIVNTVAITAIQAQAVK
ncbi:MAG: phosphate acetyltransferase [Desulfobacterales bacterium]|nr:MAG: phosphate acetyltransferase [Desulfobacterales bacterium]